MKMLKITTLAALGALVSALFLSPVAIAKDQGDLLVRLRAIAFMTDTDGTTDTLGGSARTSDAYVPELDFSYFFTKNIAAELILGSTKHTVEVKGSSSGDLDLGTVRTLPPVLTLQYHFFPEKMFSPYVGAGVNYTITFDEKKGRSVNSIKYSNEFGYAFQAGLDFKINDSFSLNLDVKKVFVDTDIIVNGGAINAKGTDLNPLIVGIGVGVTF